MRPERRKTVAVVGAGQLGAAIARRLQSTHDVILTCRTAERAVSLRRELNAAIQSVEENDQANREAFDRADIILLAVRPTQLDQVADECRAFASRQPVVVSLAAGADLSHLESIFPYARVYRAMPNIAAEFGVSFTALVRRTHDERISTGAIEKLFSYLGTTVWLEEAQLDRFTAEAASCVAFLLYLMDEVIKTSTFSPSLARKIAASVLASSDALAMQNKDDSFGTIISALATPGGATEAGLEHLDRENAGSTLRQALDKAVSRIAALARET